MRIPSFLCLVACIFCTAGYQTTSAQWEDVSIYNEVLSSTVGSWFGCGLSTADFNADGWDDVTVAGSDGWIKLYTGHADGLELSEQWLMPGEAKAVLWFDAEDDGDLDLLVGVLEVGVYFYIQQDDGSLVEEGVQRGIPSGLQQWDVRGFSVRDYDRDGDLDLYIASYHDDADQVGHENFLLQNGGNGYFEDVTITAGVGNGLKHSFQGAWVDFDEDGFDDLWLINDRSVFPNALYRNMGNGQFEDISEDVGCDIGIEAMSATLFDPDNDGDWDQYCTNIEGNPNAFLRNNDGQYEDIAATAGVASMQYGWGACAIDIDGDRWDDMMVATYRFPNNNPYDNHLYMNLGAGTQFEEQTENWPNEQLQLYCIARLDIDGDRAPDVICHGNATYDQLLLNLNSEGANRLTVDLIGTESNSRGVGAVIKVHADGMTQMRQVEAGCDYMTQHTYTRFFGLGDVESIDSLEVFWPMGGRDVMVGIPADTALTIIEGQLTAELHPLESACPWVQGVWDVPFDPAEVEMLWNGESVNAGVVIADTAGIWTLEALTWSGDVFWSQSIEWAPVPAPEITLEVLPPSCSGEAAIVSWEMPVAAMVSVADSSWPHVLDSVPFGAGVHTVLLDFGASCLLDTTFVVLPPPALELTLETVQPDCFGDLGQVSWTAAGGTPPLSVGSSAPDPAALPEGTWTFVLTDTLGCAVVDSVTVVVPDSLGSQATFSYLGATDSAQVDVTVFGGTLPYTVTWSGPVDSSGWTLAPAGLGWFISDANGCLDLGVIEIPSNPLADVGETTSGEWDCMRMDGALHFTGSVGMPLEVALFDLSGRQIVAPVTVVAPALIPCAVMGPVIVSAVDVEGRRHRWVR